MFRFKTQTLNIQASRGLTDTNFHLLLNPSTWSERLEQKIEVSWNKTHLFEWDNISVFSVIIDRTDQNRLTRVSFILVQLETISYQMNSRTSVIANPASVSVLLLVVVFSLNWTSSSS